LGKHTINLPKETEMFIRGQPNSAVNLDELDDIYKILIIHYIRVTYIVTMWALKSYFYFLKKRVKVFPFVTFFLSFTDIENKVRVKALLASAR